MKKSHLNLKSQMALPTAHKKTKKCPNTKPSYDISSGKTNKNKNKKMKQLKLIFILFLRFQINLSAT